MSEFALRIGLGALIAAVITAGLSLGVWEYVKYSKSKSGYPIQSAKLSLSALGPNVLTFVLLAPYWGSGLFAGRRLHAA